MKPKPIEAAQKVVADLNAKLGEIESREMLLNAERDQISYAVLVEGDAKAPGRDQRRADQSRQ
jgi:hypothetical protein